MRRIPLLMLGLLLLSVPSFAQQQEPVPFVDVSGTYSYVRISSTKTNYNGASMSFAVNPNPWLGIVGDVGGYHQAAPQGFPSNNLITYLFGPRLSYRTTSRITPFAQVLFGGVHATEPGQSALAMTAGGGFDLKISPRVSIRVAQGEYFLTRFGGSTQNNIRISTGLVIHFGQR
ncbi:MAG: hypothetical protein KGL59_12670 [Acidobacteriota bacterium]|nr:hypothetical protein [Acidobacteriota bacterium]